MHGWFNRQATEGPEGDRLWTLATDATPTGNWTTDCWSIPRANLGAGVSNPGLWTYHGRLWPTLPGSPGSGFGYQSGPSGYDPISNQIMVAGEFAVGDGVRRINVSTCVGAGNQSTNGPLVPGATGYNVALGGNPFSSAWSVVTQNTSPRCWIVGSPNDNLIYVWNLDAPSTFRKKSTSGGSVSGTAGAGAFYSPTNRKLVVGGANIGTTLRTLTIPSDPWNASSGFSWGTIASAGGSIATTGQFNGTFSGFQAILDMGNGQACVVMHTRDVTQPTYVYKLPMSF